MTAIRSHAPVSTEAPATDRQVSYARDLGGDMNALAVMDKRTASRYIERLLTVRRATPADAAAHLPAHGPSVPAPEPVPTRPVERPVRDEEPPFPLSMFAMLRNGFYAWQPDETTPFRFIRVKEWKSGRLRGSRVVSTQHGPNYKHAFVVFPSGQWRLYDRSAPDVILGALADMRGTALNYAHLKGRCCRCNLELTDEHSRWYGIGPVCDKVWTEIIDEVDNNLGFTFEERWRPENRTEWPEWYKEEV